MKASEALKASEASGTPGMPGTSPVPLQVFACRQCAATYFPARSLCAGCGYGDFVAVDGEQGWIEQWTELHRTQRQAQKQRQAGDLAEEQPRHYLATVRTAAGPLVVAAMDEAGAAGLAVSLFHEGARLLARRKAAA